MKHIIKTLLALLALSVTTAVSAQEVVKVGFCEPTTFLIGCQTFNKTVFHYPVEVGEKTKLLDLTIGEPSEPTTVNAEVKENEVFLFGCKEEPATKAGKTINDQITYSNVTGCDSVVHLVLKVVAAQTEEPKVIEATITKGESFLIGCETYGEDLEARADAYTKDFEVGGATVTLKLTVKQAEEEEPEPVEINATITEGEVFLLGCETYGKDIKAQADPYTYTTEIGGVNVTLNLTVNPAEETPEEPEEVTITLKQGETILLGCTEIVANEETTLTVGGVKLNIQFIKEEGTTIEATITDKETFLYGCESYYGGQYEEGPNVIPTIDGATLILTVKPAEEEIKDVTVAVKEGETILWGCDEIKAKEDGPQNAVFNGMRLNIQFIKEEGTTVEATITDKETFLYGCESYYGGQYEEGLNVIPTIDGVTLKLTVRPAEEEIKDVTVAVKEGEIILWGCKEIVATEEGPQNEIFDGMRLNIQFVKKQTVEATIKSNETFLYGCESYYGGQYEEGLNVIPTIDGVTLNLTVRPVEEEIKDVTVAVKEGEIILWGCKEIVATEEGPQNEIFDGMRLNIQFVKKQTVEATIKSNETFLYGCESYKYGKNLVEGPNTITVDGVTLNLTVVPACPKVNPTLVPVTVEPGETFLWRCETIDAKTEDVGKTIERFDTLKNIAGCDSVIYQLQLNVVGKGAPNVVTATIKDNETFLFGCKLYDGAKIVSPYTETIDGVILILTVVSTCPTVDCSKLSALKDVKDIAATAGKPIETTKATQAILDYYATWNSTADVDYKVTGVTWQIVTAAANLDANDPVAREFVGKNIDLKYTLETKADCDLYCGVTIDKEDVSDVEKKVITVQDIVCVGDSYAGKVIINKDTTWSDTTQIDVKDVTGKVIAFYDSINHYDIKVFRTVIPQPKTDVIADNKAVKGESYTGSGILKDVQAQIDADALFARNVKLTMQIKVNGKWENLTADNDVPADDATTITLRITGTSDCGDLTPTDEFDVAVKQGKPEPVTGEDTQFVCAGDSLLYNAVYYKAGTYQVTLTSLVTTGDSIVTLTVKEYNSQLPKFTLDSMPHAICGQAFNVTMLNKNIEDQAKADATFAPNLTFKWQMKSADGKWADYTNSKMPADMASVTMRMIVTTDCSTDTVTLDVMPVEQPNADLLPTYGGLPAAWKWGEWLLMIDRNSIREKYKIDPAPEDVVWYRMKGNKPDETVDDSLGTGHYYTEDAALVGEFYAVIKVAPTAEDPCGAEYRTVNIHCKSASAAPQLYPTRVAGGETMHLISLDPEVESSIRIYDAAGRMIKNMTSKGESEILLSAENMQGIYMVKVESETQKAVLRYVVVK